MVADLSDVINKPLFANACWNDFKDSTPNETKRVRFDKAGTIFPLKERYNQPTTTMKGVDATWDYNGPNAPLPGVE